MANAAPYDLRLIGGKPTDGLFTASVVALYADTGHLAWYYQTTSGDHWDFDAVQKFILADVKIGSVTRPVYPSWAGGHGWQPMSFSPRTGLSISRSTTCPVSGSICCTTVAASNSSTASSLDRRLSRRYAPYICGQKKR
jgi:hypothetical protein